MFDYGTDYMRFAERIRNGTEEMPPSNSTQPAVPQQVENVASGFETQYLSCLIAVVLTATLM